MTPLHIDLELVRKYNQPGPRYTSYPPATQFREEASVDRLLERVRKNHETDDALSLYFHLPFCASLCWFCGCTTVITNKQDQSATYLNYLKRELEAWAPLLNRRRKVVQLHFGGGTPTFLLPREIDTLGRMIHERFDVAANLEAGAEIDPRGLKREHLTALRGIGFNRVSLGVQDHNPVVQEAVHRVQPFELTKTVVEWIHDAGFSSVNIDLIYGLPHQTVSSFEKTIDEILSLQPDRLAVFSYAHVPWLKPTQKAFSEESMPTAELKLELLKFTVEKLTSSGYVYIGMDHFARETDELAAALRQKTLQRNFQGYSTHGETDLYAFGMSAISSAAGAYWQNLKDLPAYYGALEAGKLPIARTYYLTEDDRIRRRTIMQLMCNLSLDYTALSRELGIDFHDYFARELTSLADLKADGLVEETDAGLFVTGLGRLLIRNIAMRFDAYLPKAQERRFSKTIWNRLRSSGAASQG